MQLPILSRAEQIAAEQSRKLNKGGHSMLRAGEIGVALALLERLQLAERRILSLETRSGHLDTE